MHLCNIPPLAYQYSLIVRVVFARLNWNPTGSNALFRTSISALSAASLERTLARDLWRLQHGSIPNVSLSFDVTRSYDVHVNLRPR